MTSQNGIQPKQPQDKNGPGKVKTDPCLFTNDISSLNNSAYHVCAYNTVIMHTYEVQMYYVVCGVVWDIQTCNV